MINFRTEGYLILLVIVNLLQLFGVCKLKKSKYANVVSHNGRAVIHNTLFGGVIRASCDKSAAFLEEITSVETIMVDNNNEFHRELINARMLVEENMDETNLVHYYYMEQMNYELFVIPVVTRQCNFRCIYCYEEHKNESMQLESYDKLYKGIEQLIDSKGYKVLRVSFFGGEPLLEYDLICAFAKRLKNLAKQKNIIFVGHMTTNAYLLTHERLEKLVSLNVTGFQITVDGLGESHDSARFLTCGGGTWDVIMKNLTYALG